MGMDGAPGTASDSISKLKPNKVEGRQDVTSQRPTVQFEALT
jgi:hypothetical protein